MTIQSVKRAMDILTLFTPERPKLGITEISRMMDLPKPTIHGLVQTLVNRDFLMRDRETRKYSLGLKLYELGNFLSGTLEINRIGGGPAQRLSVKTGMMVRLAILDKKMMLITLNLFPAVDDSMFFRQLGLGPKVPVYCTAVGKAVLSAFDTEQRKAFLEGMELTPHTHNTIVKMDDLLAELEKSSETCLSRESEEYMRGLSCIGAPIFNDSSTVMGAISLSGDSGLFTHPDLDDMVSDLIQTSGEISLALGCPASSLMQRMKNRL